MVKRSFRRLLPAAAGLALSACTMAGISSFMLVTPGGHDLFSYAATKGDVRIVVLNNPFAISQAEVETAMAQALDKVPPTGPKATYSAHPREGSKTAIRFVFTFDPVPSQSQQEMCREDVMPAKAPGGDLLKMLVVLCDGGTLQSWATAIINRPATPQDPAFQSMIRNGVWVQIPIADPLVNGGCDDDC
ncbi:MAG: hypothetical protein H6907_21075 [Hyphomicrobiales bacterium]|nr:hypothetical protein [Hyphomicrobiales bacterium]